MSKLQCWQVILLLILFGISDRTINTITNNYSIDSLSQVLVGGLLLLLVNQLYPHDLRG